MHWSWQRLIALKQRQLQLPIHASFLLIKEENSAAVHPVRIPTAIPQSAWMCKCCPCCVLPGPLSCTKPKQPRKCALSLGYKLTWRGHRWVLSPVFLWNTLEYLHIMCPVLLQLVPGEYELFCARRRLSTDVKPLERTNFAGLCLDCTERPAQSQGATPARQIIFSKPGKAKREEQKCRVKNWVFKCANNSSDLLPNRTVIYAANLLLHRCFYSSICTDFGWELVGERPFGPAHIWVDTCACMSVWQWEKQLYSQVKTLSLIPSVEIHHHLFSFWLHQAWHFKSLFSSLVGFVFFFPFFFL